MAETLPYNVEGITWHAVVLEGEAFDNYKNLITEQFGLQPAVDQPGFAMFAMQNGTMLELYAPQAVPPYGFNDGVAFGYRVSDIEAASQALKESGYELLGDISRMEEIKYAYRHFRAKDGRVYGLNEQK
jgi:hypothetical protein